MLTGDAGEQSSEEMSGWLPSSRQSPWRWQCVGEHRGVLPTVPRLPWHAQRRRVSNAGQHNLVML